MPLPVYSVLDKWLSSHIGFRTEIIRWFTTTCISPAFDVSRPGQLSFWSKVTIARNRKKNITLVANGDDANSVQGRDRPVVSLTVWIMFRNDVSAGGIEEDSTAVLPEVAVCNVNGNCRVDAVRSDDDVIRNA